MIMPGSKWFKIITFALLIFCCGSSARAKGIDGPLRNGMKIDHSITIKPGTYRVGTNPDGILQITGSDFTVDMKNVQIIGSADSNPKSRLGIGVHITGAHNVTLKNVDVSGCLWGIVIEKSANVKLIHCMVSNNADLPPGTVIDESGHEPEDQHGGGILLRDSSHCLVSHCTAQHQWDGIDVTRSDDNIIEEGDYSFNGNWGLHLWNSSRNTFRRNRAIWCTTGAGTLYQALTGWQTYDAQAVGIDHNSNENLIADNDLRFGGDAIFIRANEGPITPGTVVPPRNGSHRNILRHNDCSFSPNNAIEVDLVDDTVIEGNNCSNSHYGMWLGYSRRCIVRNNICINDTAKAIEIENGQDDVFENNVFGYDTPRADNSLIYLRQNGRDNTISGPYRFDNNIFYGSKLPIMVTNTPAMTLSHTRVFYPTPVPSVLTEQGKPDSFPGFQGSSNLVGGEPFEAIPAPTLKEGSLRPGATATLTLAGLSPEACNIVELDGIPVWIQAVKSGRLTFAMPTDFWDRPAKSTASLRLFNGRGWSKPMDVPVQWPDDGVPRIMSVAPDPAEVNENVIITGAHITGPDIHILFDNRPVAIANAVHAALDKVIVKLPDGILTPTHYNILVTKVINRKDNQVPIGDVITEANIKVMKPKGSKRGGNKKEGSKTESEMELKHEKETRVQSWPVTLGVQIRNEDLPHLLSGVFSPTTLHVGELLRVTFTVRNNLPTTAFLMTKPGREFIYEERQSAGELGFAEALGTLHLRVTSDHPGTHDPGSWPYLFGFTKPTLAPGETITIVGFIRVSTPGTHEFRIGLVASGFRFIDDNAFRTKITVLP